MTERTVDGRPGGLPTMLKAALPALPGVNLLPGVARKGGELPDLTLHRRGVRVDRDHVAAYAAVCGFEPSQRLPITYPHLLAFGLHLEIMTDRSFPFPAIGTVHLRNRITRLRQLAATETLEVSTTAASLRPHPKGRVFDLLTSVTADGETVWESTSTYLRVGAGDDSASREGEPFDVVPATGTVWTLPGNLGRRYAAVSGDHNPIHLHPLTARAFGFRRQIAHGMWTKARSVAAFASRLPDAATVEVELRKPVFLPGRVAFGSRVVAGGLDFSVTDPHSAKAHLVGRARPA